MILFFFNGRWIVRIVLALLIGGLAGDLFGSSAVGAIVFLGVWLLAALNDHGLL